MRASILAGNLTNEIVEPRDESCSFTNTRNCLATWQSWCSWSHGKNFFIAKLVDTNLYDFDYAMRSKSASKNAGDALCEALVNLGPGFIKLGQALSTRSDLIGPELGIALTKLKDRLPPFSGLKAKELIVEETGKSPEDIFASFDEQSVAAASIAQVHRAKLKDGRLVAVKLLRPGIEKRMNSDTTLFYSLAQIFEILAPRLRRLRLVSA